MKNRKIFVLFMSFLFVFCTIGCQHNITPEGKKGIHNASDTARERSVNFEAVKSKITATDPNEKEDIEAWKSAHSTGLAAQAKALSDLDTVVNGVPVIPKTLKK